MHPEWTWLPLLGTRGGVSLTTTRASGGPTVGRSPRRQTTPPSWCGERTLKATRSTLEPGPRPPEVDERLEFNLSGMGQRVPSTELGLHPPPYFEGWIGEKPRHAVSLDPQECKAERASGLGEAVPVDVAQHTPQRSRDVAGHLRPVLRIRPSSVRVVHGGAPPFHFERARRMPSSRFSHRPF